MWKVLNLLTILVLLYLALATANAARKGVMNALFSMLTLGLVVSLMFILTPSVTRLLQGSEYVTEYVNRQSELIVAGAGYGDIQETGSAGTPAEIARAVLGIAVRAASAGDKGVEEIAAVIINCMASVLAFAIAFILGLLVRFLVLRRLEKECGGTWNHLLGIPVGLAKGMVVVWLVLGFIQLLAFASPFAALARQIEESPILMWIEQHNLLASGLAKVVTQGTVSWT